MTIHGTSPYVQVLLLGAKGKQEADLGRADII